jgi:peptide/nickel transport system substrate-binding protein
VIAITTHGLGKPASSFISSATPLHTGTGPVFPYDPAKAKALLAEAGFAGGFDLVCHALAGNEDDKNNLTTIQQMLAQVGVRMALEQLDNATRVARWRKGDFQMRSSYWTDDIFDPSEITGFMAYSPTSKCLYSGFKSERIDQLFQQSQSEIDPKKRAAQYAEIQQIWNTTGPLMLLYETPYPVAWRKEITGFVQLPLGNNYFDGVTLG